MPSITERLQAARLELAASKLKKSGRNAYAGYDYFELSDFLPKVQELCAKHNLFPLFSATTEEATISFHGLKDEQPIVFSCPFSSAALKGAHDVQNLGAVLTYTRRYLYMIAFEIVENDALDSTQGKESHQQKPASKPTQQRQIKNPGAPATEKQISYLQSLGYTGNLQGMTMGQVNDAISRLRQGGSQ